MKRGLRFVCYADDNASLLAINIYVKSIRAGNRVMEGITRFIETKLYLKVNRSKSKVDSYKTIKFLGFGFYYNPRHKQIRVRHRCCYDIYSKPTAGKLKVCRFIMIGVF